MDYDVDAARSFYSMWNRGISFFFKIFLSCCQTLSKSRSRTEVNLLVTFVYSSDFFYTTKQKKKKGERKWNSVNPRERIEVVLSIIAAVCNRSTNCSCFRFSKWIILLKVLDINAVKLDEITRRLSMVFRLWRLCTQLIQRHCSKKINNAFFHSSMFQNIHKKKDELWRDLEQSSGKLQTPKLVA